MKKLATILIAVCVCLMSSHLMAADTARGWIEKGMYYERQSVYLEAINAYSEAINVEPGNAEAYFRRGTVNALLKPSNSRAALDDFTKVIELDPENAEAYYQRGLLNAFLINNEQALADMKAAAALGHAGARFWLNPQQLATVQQQVSKFIDLAPYLSAHREPVVHFDFDSAELKEGYYPLLSEVGAVLATKLPDAVIVLMGHTDNTGAETYNDALSMQRAETVKMNLLEAHGIPAHRVVMRGFGETSPIASNETEEGKAINRRVEIVAAVR